MVTGRVVLTTITMLVPQHKEPAPPATTVSKQTPQGKTQCGNTWSSHMFRALGRASNTYVAKYGIQTHFKGNRTLKQLLVQPKDKDPKEKKSGVI